MRGCRLRLRLSTGSTHAEGMAAPARWRAGTRSCPCRAAPAQATGGTCAPPPPTAAPRPTALALSAKLSTGTGLAPPTSPPLLPGVPRSVLACNRQTAAGAQAAARFRRSTCVCVCVCACACVRACVCACPGCEHTGHAPPGATRPRRPRATARPPTAATRSAAPPSALPSAGWIRQLRQKRRRPRRALLHASCRRMPRRSPTAEAGGATAAGSGRGSRTGALARTTTDGFFSNSGSESWKFPTGRRCSLVRMAGSGESTASAAASVHFRDTIFRLGASIAASLWALSVNLLRVGAWWVAGLGL